MKSNIDKILTLWNNTGLLENAKNKLALALCLEAQKRYNESAPDMSATLRRLTIPLLVRMLTGSKAATRNNFINYFDEGQAPKTHIFKSKLLTFNGDLQAEADFCAKLAESMTTELDELFKDKMHNDIIFKGLDCLKDGTIIMHYN